MTDYTELDGLLSYEERFKRLNMQKRKNLDKLKKLKRTYVKAKMEKKRINIEVKKLQKEWADIVKTDPAIAKTRFEEMVKNVGTSDMFPRDLEDEFNKIEHDHLMGKKRTLKVEDLSNDIGLKVKNSIPDAYEKALEMELGDIDAPDEGTPPIEEPDDETRALLEPTENVGLSDHDTFIDHDGRESE